jgi:hypothetical protein
MNELQHLRAEQLRLKSFIAAERFLRALDRAKAALALEERRHNPDQPRVPAGQSGGGQWTSGGGGGGTAVEGSFDIAAGFDRNDTRNAADFISRHCNAGILQVFPGEFLGKTLGEIMTMAKSGDAKARTCVKLLDRKKYRK